MYCLYAGACGNKGADGVGRFEGYWNVLWYDIGVAMGDVEINLNLSAARKGGWRWLGKGFTNCKWVLWIGEVKR